MGEAKLWADVDQMASAHVLEAWRDPDRWPAISQALRQILRETGDSRESPTRPDPSSTAIDVSHTAPHIRRAEPERESSERPWHDGGRNSDDSVRLRSIRLWITKSAGGDSD